MPCSSSTARAMWCSTTGRSSGSPSSILPLIRRRATCAGRATVLGAVEAEMFAELLPQQGTSSATLELPAGRVVAISTTLLTLEQPHDHLLVALREVTHEQRELRELEHRALHDRLTGLPNRELVVDRLEQALTRQAREGRAVGVIFVDLDSFKEVNDRYGHAVGDQV